MIGKASLRAVFAQGKLSTVRIGSSPEIKSRLLNCA